MATTAPRRAEDVAKRIEALAGRAGAAPALVAMLDEGDAIYRGLGAEDAEWIRGHVYAVLAPGPSPDRVVLERAREDLDTSGNAVTIAGIARLVRAAPGPSWIAALEAARVRIAYADAYPDFVFDPPPTCCHPALSALGELDAALAACAASRAVSDCRDEPAPVRLAIGPGDLSEVIVEDQAGERTPLIALIEAAPAVIALFYTRCMNPAKCSLTVSALGRAASQQPEFGWFALSYDPNFDTAARLRGYGLDRRVRFSATCRLLRCIGGWPGLRARLEARVGFGPVTVNAHARELFLFAHGSAWRLPPDWLGEPERIAEFAATTG